jgi:hypothetical protein
MKKEEKTSESEDNEISELEEQIKEEPERLVSHSFQPGEKFSIEKISPVLESVANQPQETPSPNNLNSPAQNNTSLDNAPKYSANNAQAKEEKQRLYEQRVDAPVLRSNIQSQSQGHLLDPRDQMISQSRNQGGIPESIQARAVEQDTSMPFDTDERKYKDVQL